MLFWLGKYGKRQWCEWKGKDGEAKTRNNPSGLCNSKVKYHAKESTPPEAKFLDENPDKSLKSFPPYYSQSPLQLCLEISVSSNSCMQSLTVFVKSKKENLTGNHIPFPMV
jgi:hypothetical protein